MYCSIYEKRPYKNEHYAQGKTLLVSWFYIEALI